MDISRDRGGRLVPTGACWCGCGDSTKEPGNFFLPGHDKVAESAVIKLVYGSVAEFTVEHGFGPGGRNARQESQNPGVRTFEAEIEVPFNIALSDGQRSRIENTLTPLEVVLQCQWAADGALVARVRLAAPLPDVAAGSMTSIVEGHVRAALTTPEDLPVVLGTVALRTRPRDQGPYL